MKKLLLINCFFFFIIAQKASATDICGTQQDFDNYKASNPEAFVFHTLGTASNCGSPYRVDVRNNPSSIDEICLPRGRPMGNENFNKYVPEGFIITSYVENFGSSGDSRCIAGSGGIRANIRRMTSTQRTACWDSPVPTGYMVDSVDAGTAGSCTGGTKEIDDLNTSPGAISRGCTNPPNPAEVIVPPGYVVSDIDGGDCGDGYSEIDYTIPNPAGGTLACQNVFLLFDAPYPVGLVPHSASGTCDVIGGGRVSLDPLTSSDSGSAVVCLFTGDELPDGWVAGTSQSQNCTGAAQGYIARMVSASGSTDACRVLGIHFVIPTGYAVTSLSGCGSNAGYTLKKLPTSGSIDVCYGGATPIPAGYIVTATNPGGSCGTNTATITRVPSGNGPFTMCGSSSPPNGFVISKLGVSSSLCSSAVEIRRPNTTPGTETEFCQAPNTDLPTGFVVVRQSAVNSLCWRITRPDPDPGDLTSICSLGQLPNNYVIVGLPMAGTNCGGAAARYNISIPTGDGPFIHCSGPIPTGYVVIEEGVSIPICASGAKYISRASSSPISVCSSSPIPDGWIVHSCESNTKCIGNLGMSISFPSGRQTTSCAPHSNGSWIIPPGFDTTPGDTSACGVCGGVVIRGAVIPSTFIDVEADVTNALGAPLPDCSNGAVSGAFIVTAGRNTNVCP